MKDCPGGQHGHEPAVNAFATGNNPDVSETCGGPDPCRAIYGGQPALSDENVERVSLPKDPLNRSQWPTGDVLWESAKTAPLPMNSKAQAIRIPGHLAFNHMSPAIYGSAVSTAKEAMRLVNPQP